MCVIFVTGGRDKTIRFFFVDFKFVWISNFHTYHCVLYYYGVIYVLVQVYLLRLIHIIWQFFSYFHFIAQVEDQSFSAHRIVLAATIPYFYAMFTHDMAESRVKEITMKEIDPQ